MAETETETSEHTHTDVHDACFIHAALAANHRAQMRMTILGLVGLWLIMILIVVGGAANRAAEGKTTVKPAAVATAPAATASCAPLSAGCSVTGSGGSAPELAIPDGSGGSGGSGGIVNDVCTVPLQCAFTGHGGNTAPAPAPTVNDGHGGTGGNLADAPAQAGLAA